MEPGKDPSLSVQKPSVLWGLLGILASVSVAWFFSKLRAPGKDYAESVHPQTHANDGRAEAQPPLPLAVRIESYPPPTVTEQNRARERRETFYRWGNLVATWLTAIFAGGLLIITSKYAYYTFKMWGEMQTQTCIQRETRINSERAWLGLDIPPQVEVDSLKQNQFRARIILSVRNFGKGPALNTEAVGSITTHGHVAGQLTSNCDLLFKMVGIKTVNPVYSSDEDMPKLEWGDMLFPNQPFREIIQTSGNSADVVGKMAYIVGCIVYKDQFGNPHWTKFSYDTGPYAADVVRDPSSFKHLSISGANNYTDDAEKKPSCPVTQP